MCSSPNTSDGKCSGEPDENVIKGVLIGLAGGSALLAAALGVSWLAGGSGQGASGTATAAVLKETEATSRPVLASYPSGQQMTLRSSPAYSSMAADTYVTINSTIPTG